MKIKIGILTIVIACCFTRLDSAFAQIGTAFSYQGQLQTASGPAHGLYDFTFALYNASSGGTQTGSTVQTNGVFVTNGLFQTYVDFGSVFYNSTKYWLQIAVRTNGAASFSALSGRQQLTPTPYANTAENLNGSLLASQLTGTLPGGLLSGIYGNAVTLNNPANIFDGNGSGLTDLNAANLTGTLPGAVLPADVALLDAASQTFTGNNTFDSGNGTGRFIINSSGTSSVDTSLFTGLSLQYAQFTGEGAIMSSFNSLAGGDGFLSFYTKAQGSPITKQMIIDYYGVVSIDQADLNAGFLNNGNTNGAGLTFGTSSGEGIASQRTAGIDQFSLEFYTSFINRMTILNSGLVGINTTNPAAQLDVESASTAASANSVYGVISSTSPGGFSAAVRGQNNGTGGLGIGVYGSQNGSGWGIYGYTPSGIGVYGNSGSGTAVYASSGGSALTIASGAIHVSGAGVGTPTAAFIFVTASTNIVTSNGARINNPLCNGDPNAILLVTHNLNASGVQYHNHPVGLYYDGTGWQIFNEDSATMPVGIAFNVLIIKN